MRTISSKSVFRGRIIEVLVEQVELPTGEPAYREFVKHPGAVAIVALTEEGAVLLVEQMRHPVGEKLMEIPAGKLDKPGEDPETCAARELEEETDPPDSDEGEPISLSVFPIAEAIALIEDGRITDAKTIVGILLAFHHLERQRPEYSG